MPTSLKIDDRLKDRVRRLAGARERTPHWIMREAIRQYVDREEARESLYREAVESWRDYRETGLHLTGDEIERWLSTWGTPGESDMPDCHE